MPVKIQSDILKSMSIFQALILGILQGIAEFLPISSSGHLAVVQNLFGLELPLIFDVCLHLATLLAVILVFRKRIWSLLCVFARWITRKSKPEDKAELSMIVAIIVGTFVTGIMGIVASKFLPEFPIKLVFVGFIITAFLLIFSNRQGNKNASETNSTQLSPISIKQGLFVGFAQGIGTLPGISRSGITISASLLAKIDRETAGEFSFLLSIPAILGAFVLEAKDLGTLTQTISVLPLAIGCLAAFTSGVLALTMLMKLIKKGKLQWFAYYLIPLAILGLIFIK